MSKSSGPKARKKLAPKIKTDEELVMTLEHEGQIYTFPARVTDVELKTERDPDVVYDSLGSVMYFPRMPHRTLTLTFDVGQMHVQR